jgi:hypothetical protein
VFVRNRKEEDQEWSTSTGGREGGGEGGRWRSRGGWKKEGVEGGKDARRKAENEEEAGTACIHKQRPPP